MHWGRLLGARRKWIRTGGCHRSWKLNLFIGDKPKDLFPHDLVDGIGSYLSHHAHGSNMCNLKLSSIQMGDIFEAEREF